MDRKYWEKIAPGYDDEIFDVLHNDKKALIRNTIQDLARPSGTVLDAGCAVGKWLPVLSPLFREVIAMDISAGNLAIARERHTGYTNIKYRRADLSAPGARLPKCEVVVCINAILTHSMKKRDAFFSNLGRAVKKNGHLVLVVPSLESWMFSHIVQRKWQIDKAVFNERITGKQALSKYRNMLDGNLEIDRVPTKHYVKEELALLLQREGFITEGFKKIEYGWDTEFIAAPKWLKEPGPWDWLCVAKKK